MNNTLILFFLVDDSPTPIDHLLPEVHLVHSVAHSKKVSGDAPVHAPHGFRIVVVETLGPHVSVLLVPNAQFAVLPHYPLHSLQRGCTTQSYSLGSRRRGTSSRRAHDLRDLAVWTQSPTRWRASSCIYASHGMNGRTSGRIHICRQRLWRDASHSLHPRQWDGMGTTRPRSIPRCR